MPSTSALRPSRWVPLTARSLECTLGGRAQYDSGSVRSVHATAFTHTAAAVQPTPVSAEDAVGSAARDHEHGMVFAASRHALPACVAQRCEEMQSTLKQLRSLNPQQQAFLPLCLPPYCAGLRLGPFG